MVADPISPRISRFYIDIGQSGMTLQRPEFERLLKDCKAGKISTVLITNVDRLARDKSLVAEALQAFGRYKVRIRLGDEAGLKFFWTVLRAISEVRI